MLSWLHTNLIKRDSFERDLERSNLEQDLGGCLRFEEILYMTAACKASGITLDQEALRKILHQCWRDNSDAALKKSPYYAPYRRWRALERNSLLGNNLSPEVNQRYALYREKCRESFQNGSGVAESNDVQVEGLLGGLDTNGICAIEGANIGELAKLGQRALDRSLEENRFPHFIDYGRIWGYPTEEEGVAMARDLYSVLSEPLVEQCLHGFFGSHFRLFIYCIYSMVPYGPSAALTIRPTLASPRPTPSTKAIGS